MGARDDAIAQAVDDFEAYVETLDLDEVLGELLHMSRFHDHVMARHPVAGVADRLAAIALGAMAERLGKLAVKPIQQPPHDGAVHSCTLLARMLAATMTKP